jgi:dihydroorotase-like cyclic amidohydrolase
MRLTRTTLVLVSLAALALGGCSAIFGQPSKLNVTTRSDIEAGDAFAEAQMAAGRTALVEGRYAAAVASFSKARTSAELAGEALNGMAVAYSGIGRLDLAERYFRQAIVVAPGDERFRRNLARLQTIGPALQAGAAEPQLAAAPRPAAAEARPVASPVRVALPQNGLTRVSPGEVVLRTGTAPAAAPARSARPAGQAIVRIDLSKIARPAR